MIARAAGIDQEFLSEYVSEVILDLPNLIMNEQQYKMKQSDVIRFRVSGTDKAKIEKKAIAKDYDSISKYLRDVALNS